jgi:cellulose synthase/poly-beta-1,6-N-acetylglucosamine synthase-like glycosyltransferase
MNQDTPLLTIVVPMRNFDMKIHKIEKWITQIDYKKSEVIVVHDSDSEESKCDLEKLFQQYPNCHVKLITVDVKSPGLARNIGIEHSCGEFITFWDADDLPHYEVVMRNIFSCPENSDVILGRFNRITGDEIILDKSFRLTGSLKAEKMAVNPGMWRFVFRKSFIKGVVFKDYQMGEDVLFLSQILGSNPKILFTDDVFYSYTLNVPNSLTSKKDKLADLPRVINELLDLCFIQEFRNSMNVAFLCKLSLTYFFGLGYKMRFQTVLKIPKLKIRHIVKISLTLCLLLYVLLLPKKVLA